MFSGFVTFSAANSPAGCKPQQRIGREPGCSGRRPQQIERCAVRTAGVFGQELCGCYAVHHGRGIHGKDDMEIPGKLSEHDSFITGGSQRGTLG